MNQIRGVLAGLKDDPLSHQEAPRRTNQLFRGLGGVDDAAAKKRAAEQKSFTDSLKAANAALDMQIVELTQGERAALEFQVQIKEAEAANLGLAETLADQLKIFREMTLGLPGIKTHVDAIKAFEAAADQDFSELSKMADDLGRIGAAAQDAAVDLEKMARAAREALDDQDRAQFLPDTFGVGLGAETKRIAADMEASWSGIDAIIDSSGQGITTTLNGESC